MGDNFPLKDASDATRNAASDQVTYSGDTADVQLFRPVLTTGAEGGKTVVDLPGDASNGLDVDVTRLPALVAGTANIGDVDVLTVPVDPFGANADAASASGSISAKLRQLATAVAQDGGSIGATPLLVVVAGKDASNNARSVKTATNGEQLVQVSTALPAGTNAIGKLAANDGVDIGNVDVASLPSLPAGTNNIGDVDVLTQPARAHTTDSIKVGDGTAFIDIDTAPTDGETNGGKRLLHTESWLWGYNGVSWDRLRSDTTNGLDVDVTRLPSLVAGNANIGDVDVATVPAPLSTTGGGTEAAALRVTLANDSTGLVSVDDNAGSLTVDAPVGTPVAVRLSDGAAFISALPVTDNGGALTVDNGGTFAVQATLSAETTKVIGTVNVSSQSTLWKCVQSTTATTTNIWTPGSGKKIALTYLQIQAGGTTAGTVQVWFAASGDTTYGRGTDAAVFDGEFAPSATLKPGVALAFPVPLICPTADYLLKVTTSAAINPLTVTAWGYEV